MKVKRRLDYDLLRAVSMLAVVYLHTAAGALREPGNADVWHFSNLLTALFTTAVPLFFMMSGALLLRQEKTADISSLFRHRLPRIFIPLLVWSAVVMLRAARNGGWDAVWGLLTNLLHSPVMVPYWFLYALVPIYLVIPFLKKMADGLSGAHWAYLVGLWLTLTLGLHTLKAFIPSCANLLQVHWTLNLDMVGGYLGYFLLGAALDRWKTPPGRKVLWPAGVVLYLIIAFGTFRDVVSTGAYNERYKDYLNLFAALLAIVIFLLARSYLGQKESGRIAILFSGISFGVYLMHPLAIEFVMNRWYRVFGSYIDTIPEQVACYLVITGICIVGTLVLASIPGLCFLFTGQKFRTARRESSGLALLDWIKSARKP